MSLTTSGTELQSLLELRSAARRHRISRVRTGEHATHRDTRPGRLRILALAAEGRMFYTEASDHYTCPSAPIRMESIFPPTSPRS